MLLVHFRHGSLATLLVALISSFGLSAQIDTFGKLKITADDNTFSARLTGMVQLDADFYETGSQNRRLPSGSFVRRARIGLQGNFHEWEYSVDSDFSGDQTALKDAFLRRSIGPGKITVGQFKVFEGLEQVISGNDITFLERSYASDLVAGFQLGVAYNGNVGILGYSGTVYNLHEASDIKGQPSNSGLGEVIRVYLAPVNRRNMAFHFGCSYAHVNTDDIGSRIRVVPAGRAEQYKDLGDFKFVVYDRRNEKANINRFLLESLVINGPLSLQGEYVLGSADTKTRASDDFHAWYAQMSYMLTGEWRKYKFQRGEVNRPVPSRKVGALEGAIRYQEASRDNVADAKLSATEFGVTYYANINVRFMLNYSLIEDNLSKDDPNLISFRAQFDF